MTSEREARYRIGLIRSFSLPPGSDHPSALDGPKEQRLMNYGDVAHLFEDIEWDLICGPAPSYGNWAVENREEFLLVGAARLEILKKVCESGKYDAIVLLGGGEPGYAACREIAHRYRIPVTSAAFAQMHVATMLGNRFSIIDLAESHAMHYYDLVVQHRFTDRCASIRSINYPHSRPGHRDAHLDIHQEKQRALRGETSDALEAAVQETIAAIEDDGADVITFGCSGLFWMRPFVQQRLDEIGWDVPVLEGYATSIVLAKALVDLKVDASGLVYPRDRPRQWRRKRTF